MNKEYQVEIESTQIGEKTTINLSITHNGNTWSSIRILDPAYEIPKIIEVLNAELKIIDVTTDYKQLIHDANNYLSGGGCGAASVQQAAKRYREMKK